MRAKAVSVAKLMNKSLLLVATLMVSACAQQTFENVELGMNKQEVIEVAGRPDSVIASHEIDDELVEIFEYRQGGWWWRDLDETYWFFFVNEKLQKWGRPGDYLRYVDSRYVD